ncbi:MAG: transposase [Candidatus Aminicenantes bacterium]|nr:transposase [Candidatus Aminicenantes bacterium]
MEASANGRKRARRREIVRRARLTGNVAEACRFHGISRTTFYKWLRRFESEGPAGLDDKSRRPHGHPRRTPAEVVAKIVFIRRVFGLGPAEIGRRLESLSGFRISGPGVWKVLRRLGLHRRCGAGRRLRAEVPPPEEKRVVRLDVRPIQNPLVSRRLTYLYIAAEEESGLRFIRTFDRIEPATAIRFIEEAIRRLPFRVGAVKTDAGPEWKGYVHAGLLGRGIDHFVSRTRKPDEKLPLGHSAWADGPPAGLEEGLLVEPEGFLTEALRRWERLYKIGR